MMLSIFYGEVFIPKLPRRLANGSGAAFFGVSATC
jgi:hypothetical protein